MGDHDLIVPQSASIILRLYCSISHIQVTKVFGLNYGFLGGRCLESQTVQCEDRAASGRQSFAT